MRYGRLVYRMKQSQLILSQTPPFPTPLRFFMTAPLFGVAAAAAMLFLDERHFISRWPAGMLAYVHLLVLGYLAMVMQGALLQVVSVLLGGRPYRVERLAAAMHVTLVAGTLLLAAGFLSGRAYFMHTAVLLLALSFILFAGAVVSGLFRGRTRRAAGFSIGLALAGLLVTVGLGLWLAVGHSVPGVALARHLTDIHLSWGLLGWGAILLMTVAYAVVPMFQLTPEYPGVLVRALTPAIAGGLLLWSGAVLLGRPVAALAGSLVVAAGLVLFAVVTLRLQQQRKRKPVSEVTLGFWRCAMASLLAAVVVWVVAPAFPALGRSPAYPLLLGLLVIHGFLISAVNGMLYKIMPFLTWLHLSIQVTEHKLSRRLVPNIKKLLPDDRAALQLRLHLVALLLTFLALWWPAWWLAPAAVVFAASNLLLWLNLRSVLQVYKKTRDRITEVAAEKRAEGSATASPT